MLQIIKRTIYIIAIAVVPLLSLSASMPPSVYADSSASKTAACAGIGLTGSNCSQNADVRVGSVVNNVVKLLSVLVGLASIIMIIIAGFKYVTSGGESNSIAGAKNTLIYAIVGLIIVALAQFIVHFVLARV